MDCCFYNCFDTTSMVSFNYFIKCCVCGQEWKGHIESGDSDYDYSDVECSHFRIARRRWTKTGWLFGGNAKASLSITLTHKSTGASFYKQHNYWGWNNGDSISQTMSGPGYLCIATSN